MDTDDFLAHYGVKGMRWGVRKPRGDQDEIFRRRYLEKRTTSSKSADKKKAGQQAAEQVLDVSGDEVIPEGTPAAKAGQSLIQRFFFGDKSQPRT
jgi:hypothetical protein